VARLLLAASINAGGLYRGGHMITVPPAQVALIVNDRPPPKYSGVADR